MTESHAPAISEPAEPTPPPTPREEALERSQRKTQGKWWYLRHPYARLITALGIFVLDFLYYCEDPIVHSHLMTQIPVAGQAATMLLAQWPSTVGLRILKVLFGWLCVLVGCVVGRQLIHHKLLRKCNMFENDNGCWTVMCITSVVSLWIGSYMYNAMVGSAEPQITSDLHIEGFVFGIIAQMFTWLGDLWTLVMVLDSMLQDSRRYPQWAVCVKGCWAEHRVVSCWVLAVVPTFICFTFLILEETGDGTSHNAWDDVSPGSTELGRCILVSMVVLCDLSILVQDWEFPTFDSDLAAEIKLPGTNVTHVEWELCTCIRESACFKWFTDKCVDEEFFHVHISGKWIAYGPLLVIICLDLNCARNQSLYEPINYGQYINPDSHRIWTIVDKSVLNLNYDGLDIQNSSAISWSARKGSPDTLYASQLTDYELSTEYAGYSLIWECLALAPGILSIPAAIFYFIARNEDVELRKTKWKSAGRKVINLMRMGKLSGMLAGAAGVAAATSALQKTDLPSNLGDCNTDQESVGGKVSDGSDEVLVEEDIELKEVFSDESTKVDEEPRDDDIKIGENPVSQNAVLRCFQGDLHE